MTHWPPKVNDRVYDEYRVVRERNPRGTIVRVDHKDKEIHVKFKGKTVEFDIHDRVDFDRHTVCRLRNIRIDGILHHSSIAVDCPEWLYPGGDQQSYSFDHFDIHGEYESSDGGEGVWQLTED